MGNKTEYAKIRDAYRRKLSRLTKQYNVPEEVAERFNLPKYDFDLPKKTLEKFKKALKSDEITQGITKTVKDFETGDVKEIPYTEYLHQRRSEAGKKGNVAQKANKSETDWLWKYGADKEIIWSNKAEELFNKVENHINTLLNFISSAKQYTKKETNEDTVHAIGKFLKETYDKQKADNPKGLLLSIDMHQMHIEELFVRIITEYKNLKDPSSAVHEIYYIITGDYSEQSAKGFSERFNQENIDEGMDEELEEVPDEDLPW